MSYLDIAAFEATPLTKEPFQHIVVPGFLRQEVRDSIVRDYPEINKAGSFPLTELTYGAAFRELVAEMQGPTLRAAFERKFDIDLSERPTMMTVRGQAREKDGRIHTDTKSKLITVLLYMNSSWEAEGGRLRLLRSPDSLDDAFAEVPPNEGTLLAFKVADNSWHGHAPFVGRRRVIQLNWVRDEEVVRQEQARHRFSARVKKLLPFAS